MNQTKNRSFKGALCLLLALGIFAYACRKSDDVVPNVYVDIYVYTSDPAFVNLNVPGGWVYITGGAKGIIIYRKSTTDFMAYERNCTYNPSEACARVEVDSSNVLAVDKCCGSQFSIIDGSVVKTPATMPLKQYQTSFDGNVLHIYN